MTSVLDAERAQKQLRARFGRLEGVRGIGVTWNENGDAHVRVNVDGRKRESVSKVIPSEVDGVAVELRSVGALKTFAGRR